MDGIVSTTERLGAWVGRWRAELRFSLRVAVAGLVTFVLAELFDLPQGYWAVLTAVMVMQASVGGSLKATLDRLIGTLGGAAVGAGAAVLFAHGDRFSLGLALALALAPLAFVAAFKPSFRIAPMTAVIVLLATSRSQTGPLASALERVLEIGLGSLVGLCASLLVLPARAHGLVVEAAGEALDLLAELVTLFLADLTRSEGQAALPALNERIRAALARLDVVAEEAKRERASHLSDEPDPEPLLRTLRRLRNDLVMVGRCAAEPMPVSLGPRLAAPLERVAAATAGFLRDAGSALAERQPLRPLGPTLKALDAYAEAMAAVRLERATLDFSAEAAERVFALGFAFEQLRPNLADLASRVREFATVHRRAFPGEAVAE